MNGPDMTTPTTPQPYQAWPPQPMPPVPPRKGLGAGKIVLIVIAAVVVLIVGLAILGAALTSGQPAAKPPTAWDREQSAQKSVDAQPTTAPTEPAVAAGPVLTADQVKLSLKTTDKACFGSAGCNVTVKVNMAYDGAPLDSGTTWEVTYEIAGGEDGPQIGTFDVTGSQYDVNEETLSTKSTTTKLHVKVTSVDKLGI